MFRLRPALAASVFLVTLVGGLGGAALPAAAAGTSTIHGAVTAPGRI